MSLDYEVHDLGNVALQRGATIRDCKLAYKTFGKLNAAKDNVIVYPTWYSGQHYDNEWLVGAGMALDPALIPVPTVPLKTLPEPISSVAPARTTGLAVVSLVSSNVQRIPMLKVTGQGYRRPLPLAFERDADKVTIAPDQPATGIVRKLSNDMPNSEGSMFRPFSRMPAPWLVTSRTQQA
jgi:hypothetical protein